LTAVLPRAAEIDASLARAIPSACSKRILEVSIASKRPLGARFLTAAFATGSTGPKLSPKKQVNFGSELSRRCRSRLRLQRRAQLA
jgi:hypothetical protein